MSPGEDVRSTLVARVVGRVRELVPEGPPADVRACVEEAFEAVALEDLDTRGIDYLAAGAAALWDLAQQRPAATARLRVASPPGSGRIGEPSYTVVEIVNDDMAFLVDSVTMAIERQGYGVRLVVHPVLGVRRDADGRLVGVVPEGAPDALPESWMRVEIDRETDPARLEELHAALEAVLADVRAASTDAEAMAATARAIAAELRTADLPVDPDETAEAVALLEWIADDHFTFLGFREYDFDDAAGEGHLRSCPETGLGILRPQAGTPPTETTLRGHLLDHARSPTLLTLTKANSISTVHRPVHLDYIGVKRYDADGRVVGERRFLGIFAVAAYSAPLATVPVVRRTAGAVLARAGLLPDGHDAKTLQSILESYPRDELFQADANEVLQTAMGILRLQERRRVRLFVRREPFERFVSCLVFVPRDRYPSPLRLGIPRLLSDAYGATHHEWGVLVAESALARLHFLLHTDPEHPRHPEVRVLEAQIAALARTWSDDLRDALVAHHGEPEGLRLFHRYRDAFPAGYAEAVPAGSAPADIDELEGLAPGSPLDVRLAGDGSDHVTLRLAGLGAPRTLAEVMPVLRNLDLEVVDERLHQVEVPGDERRWLASFGVRSARELPADPAARRVFEDAAVAILSGTAEDDSLNRLVPAAGLSWREVDVLRGYGRYLRQAGVPYSQQYVADALVSHPEVARLLVELFVCRFDPNLAGTDAQRERHEALVAELVAAVDAVSSLDEDRILRSLLRLVLATLRTNWFQRDAAGATRPALALKLDPSQVPELPKPRPMFEIFVSSPRVEGVHLRSGRVARGGIRWSDRREDFRTEILGLMKAQRVKKAVIVPVGAEGGFVVRRPPSGADRDALHAEVVACYRTFIGSLLDVTDDREVGAVAPPPDTVRYDPDDPYLVVAADKGTAAFSDTANGIALDRGFWLGDAFASGGSTGYDHKRMGITARGAWESVKHHFRELGIDVQTTPFTVAGIGDMSGDVFGNGMLLSRGIRLVAAFDHRHVFLDPDPDPAISFAERERLFALPRSSWGDYDTRLLSDGGGVHPRSAKSIPLTPPVRARLGLDDSVTALTPAELIRTILLAPVDLLWNGGIGTYVKSSEETHADAGDKANDAVRVDGRDLRCQVVGEGGNLGFTQRGRVEYALAGGRINTDAIDNSAGVDCSDHEVNIKVLLDSVIATGALDLEPRNALLAEMTDEVGDLVLRDNYQQNRALANARAQAGAMGDVHARYLRALEQSGHLDRAVELLPSDSVLAARRTHGLGLTGPELAVLLAYTKITLADALVDTDLPDDPDVVRDLLAYFPAPLRERYAEHILAHPLQREIVTTVLVNGMVNRAGTTFAFRLGEETGGSVADIVRAHEVARAVYDVDALGDEIAALDNLVPAAVQTEMYLESRKLVERASRWLLRHRPRPLPIAATIAALREPVQRGVGVLDGLLRAGEREWVDAATATWSGRGVPRDLAHRVAMLESAFTALDLATLAGSSGWTIQEVAAIYTLVGDRLQLDWLRDRVVEDLPRDDRWRALARTALREDAYEVHRAITAGVLASTDPGLDVEARFEAWRTGRVDDVARIAQVLADIRTAGVYDLATLSVGLRELRSLVAAGA